MKPIKGLKKMIQDKKEWQAHMKRVKALPADYQVVYKEVEKYLFNFSAGDGMDTVAGIYQLVDFLEEGAQNQIPVLDYVGQFAESYRQSLATKSWADDWKEKAQKNVDKKLKELKEGNNDDPNH